MKLAVDHSGGSVTPRLSRALVLAGFLVLAAIALAGWLRKPEGTFAANLNPNSPGSHPRYAQPIDYDANGRRVYAQSPTHTKAGTLTCVESSAPEGQMPLYQVHTAQSRRRPVRVVSREYAGSYSEGPPKKRSTGKPVPIVPGISGAGAAIGGLAGRGQGAAVDATSGGTAGFVYERLTHDRR